MTSHEPKLHHVVGAVCGQEKLDVKLNCMPTDTDFLSDSPCAQSLTDEL